MKFRVMLDGSTEVYDGQRCNFGITEAIGGIAAALGGADILGGIGGAVGLGEAAADTGTASLGALETGTGLIGGAGAGAGGLTDIVGTGAGLAGGTTGLAGTLGPVGGAAAGGIEGVTGLGAGATALGSASDFLSEPAASAFNNYATTAGAAGFGTDPSLGGLPSTGGSSPTVGPGATGISPTDPNSVFNTGTSAVSNLQPAAPGAASVAAPSGVASPTGVDATAAAGGQVPGAVGPTSLNGAQVAGGSGGSGSLIDNLLGKATSSITNNPLGVGLGAAGLGYNIYQGQQATANQKALTADAATATANSNNLVSEGSSLTQYLTSGTLPAEYQTQITQAINSAIATAKSNAAAQGLSTDPTQNTALAATIAQINNQQPILQEQIAQQLATQGDTLISAGQSAAGLSGSLYSTLVQNDTTQAANTGKAIATLAAALNGKSSNSIGGTNITVSQA